MQSHMMPSSFGGWPEGRRTRVNQCLRNRWTYRLKCCQTPYTTSQQITSALQLQILLLIILLLLSSSSFFFTFFPGIYKFVYDSDAKCSSYVQFYFCVKIDLTNDKLKLSIFASLLSYWKEKEWKKKKITTSYWPLGDLPSKYRHLQFIKP